MSNQVRINIDVEDPIHETLRKYMLDDLSTIWTEGKINKTLATYLTRRSDRMAIVRINFEDPEATLVLIDAKVSLADMVGNIGGTFGVFLGLSVVGLFNYMVDLKQLIVQKFF